MCLCTVSDTEGITGITIAENDMEELGIKETQELISAVKNFVAAFKKAYQDKKLSFGEILDIIPKASKVAIEGKDYEKIMAEIHDLDGEEAKEALCDVVDIFFFTSEIVSK